MPEGLGDFDGCQVLCYEEVLDDCMAQLRNFSWPQLDENTPSGLCYTSGTTGNPKVHMISS